MQYENFLSKKVQEIKPSGIRKFFDLASEMEGVISLGVGEPDFDTPWHIREAAIYSIESGKTHYTANQGLLELREEICAYQKRRFHLDYDPVHNVIITVGGSEGIDIAMRAIVNPGDEVILMEPSYVAYTPSVQLTGAIPVHVKLEHEEQFKLTPEKLEAAITPKTKAILLNFPSNPISGFSKAYAMTGWRLGYVLANQTFTEAMNKIHQYIIMSAPTGAQYGAIDAMRNGDIHVQEMKEAYMSRRNFITKGFNRIGLPTHLPQGAFYIFPDIRSTGLTSDEFCEQLLNEQKVACVPGTAFGDAGEGFIRVSYAYSIEHIKEAIERIDAFMKKFR